MKRFQISVYFFWIKIVLHQHDFSSKKKKYWNRTTMTRFWLTQLCEDDIVSSFALVRKKIVFSFLKILRKT